ncbi:phosphatidylserine decarboxylase [Formicincola oecophyllae]|uniref:Phosphatidylserine decarboxylase proenzyme n=2 Tax=Formicincola oecophyllae TaxID=2558361 RepID=A0A4Y6U7F0_9PROT|nr:phosphatidylserine decarboxylase [Formicincola oecophyllae]
MSLLQSLKMVSAPPHPEGWRFVLPGAGLWALTRFSGNRAVRLAGDGALAFAGFAAYFFRNPERVTPDVALTDKAVVSAADGHVTSVEEVVPPPELNLGQAPRWRVATFLSVMDVHINRAPVSGEVVTVAYTKGKFLNASLDKASEHNERNGITLRMEDGREVGVVQIAGLVARRIVCEVQPGQWLRAGQIFGLIRFGSRTDVYLPLGVKPIVEVGQTMIGGETIIATL